MAKLVWDAIGEHFYETGVDHGILFLQKDDGTYDKGVAWNGLIEVAEKPSGADPNNIYADNIKYLTLRGAEEFGATIQAYTYPDEFMECDGSAVPVQGVVLGQQPRKAFGFAYRSLEGNDIVGDRYGYKLHIIYGATASPSERTYSTVNDNPDAIQFSWDIDTVPVEVEGYRPTSIITIDSTKADATKLAAFEAILQGSETADPRLPLPNEVLELLGLNG